MGNAEYMGHTSIFLTEIIKQIKVYSA